MMRTKRRSPACFLPLLLAAALAGCSQNPQASSIPENGNKPGLLSRIFESTRPVTVPEGTPIEVAIDQSLSSAASRSGDSFEGTLAAPILVDGMTAAPRDTRVRGHVVDAQASGRLKGVARLDLTLDALLVNGKEYTVATSDLDRTGRNHNKRNGELIGGGAGVGALIGALAGGGKGALIGGAVGAGAGTGTAAYTGKQDIHIPAETRLTFRLERPLTINVTKD